MPKRKEKIPFVKGFSLPDEEEVAKAVGNFPCASPGGVKHRKREETLLGVSGGNHTSQSSVKQIDEESFFANAYKGKASWKPLPSPMDEASWLANINEEGQTFSQYVSMITLRSGQFKPNTNHLQTKIYIVPIVDHNDAATWPNTGPDLHGLAAWMSAFFCRDVEILDAVLLRPLEEGAQQLKKRARACAKKKQIVWMEGGEDGRQSVIEGRICTASGRYQTHVDGLLGELLVLREYGMCGGERGQGQALDDAFAVVGVTLCDLYSGADDLFVAGMAAGGSKVAVLSFARYHPMLKMCPERWQDYGYIKQSSSYSYYEDNKPRPATFDEAPAWEDMTARARAEYFRRAGKLLMHEMCHVYGIDHCIHYHCLMNGTAHLVEDFASPCHICCICLRKLNFRLGFDIKKRYQDLNEVYNSFGMVEQVKWTSRKLASLVTVKEGENEEEDEEDAQQQQQETCAPPSPVFIDLTLS